MPTMKRLPAVTCHDVDLLTMYGISIDRLGGCVELDEEVRIGDQVMTVAGYELCFSPLQYSSISFRALPPTNPFDFIDITPVRRALN